MKEPDYVINTMVSWTTLDELEGANTRRDCIAISGTNDTNDFINWRPFGIHSDTYINQTTTTSGYKIRFPYIGHGQPSSGLIATLPGIFLCKSLIQLLHQVIFKIMGWCNQVCGFGEH